MTTKAIGPNFSFELAAAGLAGLPFSWSPDGGLVFSPAITPAQVTAIEAVYTAHDPATVPISAAAAAILAGGVTVTSASKIVPTTVWPIDPATQRGMLAIATILATLGTFPGGAATWPVPDQTGTVHNLTVAQFKAVQGACAQVGAQCDMVLAGLTTTLPATAVSIP